MKDAFGDPPRPAVLLMAMTELRLLSGHWGIESIIKKDPDVVLTVTDAAKAQTGLGGAPGTLRVIDPRTIYFRPPPSFLESETLLMVLRNLMKQAYEREQAGEAVVAPGKAPVATEAAQSPAKPQARPQPAAAPARQRSGQPTSPKNEPRPALHPDVQKLQSLREQGILTDKEFQAALQRLLSKAKA